MKLFIPLLATVFLLSGCSMFRPPQSANRATLPTGSYDSASEKWADEALSAQRKAEKEKTEADLKKLDRN